MAVKALSDIVLAVLSLLWLTIYLLPKADKKDYWLKEHKK